MLTVLAQGTPVSFLIGHGIGGCFYRARALLETNQRHQATQVGFIRECELGSQAGRAKVVAFSGALARRGMQLPNT